MNFLVNNPLSSAHANAILQSLSRAIIVSNLSELPPSSCRYLIGTHDGSFHCDECLAIGMLATLPQYCDPLSQGQTCIVRTRNAEVLKQCNIVVDVGAIYEPNTLRFDHHQREFTGVQEGFNTKLSSAGLIYRHFGKDIIKSLLSGLSISDDFVDVCYPKVYKGFVEHIDAIDNGIAVADGELRYVVPTTLSARVGRLNALWNEPQSASETNERFRAAMRLTCGEFIEHVLGLATSWWPAREIVLQAMHGRKDLHESGSIMLLRQSCPWKEHLLDLEKEQGIAGQLLYVVFPDSGGSWRVQAVPVESESFECRRPLPASIAGLRDEVLSTKLNLPGCIFVHANGFIGGHKDQEGAVRMAIQALEI